MATFLCTSFVFGVGPNLGIERIVESFKLQTNRIFFYPYIDIF